MTISDIYAKLKYAHANTTTVYDFICNLCLIWLRTHVYEGRM